ncbi:hypothetical protein VTK56DRAFT_2378 [Thermocarpiscus australiensis]
MSQPSRSGAGADAAAGATGTNRSPQAAAAAATPAITATTNTDYDPACDTLRFDMLAVLAHIDDKEILCVPCKQSLFRTARRAFERRLANNAAAEDLTLRGTPSQVRHAWYDARAGGRSGGGLQFVMSANPQQRRVVDEATRVRMFCNPDRHDAMVEATVDALFEPGDDVWNLAQCQLWCVLDGFYSIADAVRGRSVAEFLRTFMQPMNRRSQHRRSNLFERRTCQDNEGCFGGHLPAGYPGDGDIGAQTRMVLWAATERMDRAVEQLVVEQLSGCPEGEDIIAWVATPERAPAFRARLEALRHKEDYAVLKRDADRRIREWREGGAARAEALARLPQTDPVLARYIIRGEPGEGEVDEGTEREDLLRMLQDMVNLVIGQTYVGQVDVGGHSQDARLAADEDYW